MVRERHGWLHSGHWSRGSERIDYVLRLDTYLLYLRYSGDDRFNSGWQTAILNLRVTKIEGEIWSVSCPFCTTNVRSILVGPKSLRCASCLRLPTRWSKQNAITYPYRVAIRKGALSEVKAALQGSPKEKFLAMMAMELTGLSPKKMSSPKGVGPWVQTKNRSISRWKWFCMVEWSGFCPGGRTRTAKKCLNGSGYPKWEKCQQSRFCGTIEDKNS